MSFAERHLKGLGWAGEGTALREGARARPINAHQKKSAISGIGKETVSTFAWWETLYDNAARKKGKPSTTATGIISPHEQSTSKASHYEAIADAKKTAARATLYAKFLRGPIIAPEPEPAVVEETRSEDKSRKRPAEPEPAVVEQEPKARKRSAEDDDERRERKRLRKEAKAAAKADADALEAKAKRKEERRRRKAEAQS